MRDMMIRNATSPSSSCLHTTDFEVKVWLSSAFLFSCFEADPSITVSRIQSGFIAGSVLLASFQELLTPPTKRWNREEEEEGKMLNGDQKPIPVTGFLVIPLLKWDERKNEDPLQHHFLDTRATPGDLRCAFIQRKVFASLFFPQTSSICLLFSCFFFLLMFMVPLIHCRNLDHPLLLGNRSARYATFFQIIPCE